MNVNGANRAFVDPVRMNRIISLLPGEIHLWLAFYDEINEELLLSAYPGLLHDAEKKQEPRFFFARDRRRYLITRALVRTVLSPSVDIQPREGAFSANADGRPSLAN